MLHITRIFGCFVLVTCCNGRDDAAVTLQLHMMVWWLKLVKEGGDLLDLFLLSSLKTKLSPTHIYMATHHIMYVWTD